MECERRAFKKAECEKQLIDMARALSMYVKPSDFKMYRDVVIDMRMQPMGNPMSSKVFTYSLNAATHTETYSKPKDCMGIAPPDANVTKTGIESVRTYFNDMISWFCDVNSALKGPVQLQVRVRGKNVPCNNGVCEAMFVFDDNVMRASSFKT